MRKIFVYVAGTRKRSGEKSVAVINLLSVKSLSIRFAGKTTPPERCIFVNRARRERRAEARCFVAAHMCAGRGPRAEDDSEKRVAFAPKKA